MSSTMRQPFGEDEIRARVASVNWFHQIEIVPGIVTPGVDRSAEKLRWLNLPEDLRGQRVLDIGAFDGFFSFECERRGAAEVIAIDAAPPPGFTVAHELLGSQVKFYAMNIYELKPEVFGQFDLVLCLGVLYHLRHPLLGLERVHAVCRGKLILETAVCDHHFVNADQTSQALASIAPALAQVPIAQFYPGAELNGDATNWWSPNIIALHGMLRSTGFVPLETAAIDSRACVHCLRVEAPEILEWVDTARFAPPKPGQHVPESIALAPPDSALAETPAVATPPADPAVPRLLAEALATQSRHVIDLQQRLDQRDARIADIEGRSRWLEEQARASQRALAAVENGRVMRLLRWLARARS
jgi:tRNA (mo5U34)-methyltransferase